MLEIHLGRNFAVQGSILTHENLILIFGLGRRDIDFELELIYPLSALFIFCGQRYSTWVNHISAFKLNNYSNHRVSQRQVSYSCLWLVTLMWMSSSRQGEVSSFDKGRFLVSVVRSTCTFISSSLHLILSTNNRKSCIWHSFNTPINLTTFVHPAH